MWYSETGTALLMPYYSHDYDKTSDKIKMRNGPFKRKENVFFKIVNVKKDKRETVEMFNTKGILEP